MFENRIDCNDLFSLNSLTSILDHTGCYFMCLSTSLSFSPGLYSVACGHLSMDPK